MFPGPKKRGAAPYAVLCAVLFLATILLLSLLSMLCSGCAKKQEAKPADTAVIIPSEETAETSASEPEEQTPPVPPGMSESAASGKSSQDQAGQGKAVSSINRITSEISQPRLYGNNIIFYGTAYNIISGVSSPIETTRSYALYDDKIAYSGYDGIYLYPLKTKLKERLVNASYSNFIDFYDNIIVWSEGLSVYMYNIDTKSKSRLSLTGLKPRVSSKYIVWYDVRNNNKQLNKGDIYAYDLANAEEKKVTNSLIVPEDNYLSIYNSIVVFTNFVKSDAAKDNRKDNFDVFMIDIDTGEEKRITTDPANQVKPSIYGDFIVWQDYRSMVSSGQQASQPASGIYDIPSQIYIYTITSAEETQLTSTQSGKSAPQVFENKIIWYERTGIYLAVLE